MSRKRTSLSARRQTVKDQAASIRNAVNTVGGGSALKVEKEKIKPVALTVRLQPELHEELRRIAFEKRVSIHSLLLKGVEQVVEHEQ